MCQGRQHKDINIDVHWLDLLLECVIYLDCPGKKSVFPDGLEIDFGVLCTMVGNNMNVDMYSLVKRLSRVTKVSNIFAKHLEWDRQPCHLKLPTLS